MGGAAQQRTGLGDVQAVVGLEAPGVDADRQVVGERVIAGEVEIDEARQILPEEENIVGEQVGVDHAGRQIAGPVGRDFTEFCVEQVPQAGDDIVGLVAGLRAEGLPPRNGHVVVAMAVETLSGVVHPRERGAERGAVFGRALLGPDAGQEGYDRGRPAGEFAQSGAIASVDRRRTGNPAFRQMIHEAQKIRQIGPIHPFFIEGQDVALGCGRVRRHGLQQVVGVLDAFRDALERYDITDVVIAQKGDEVFIVYVGVDSHRSVPLSEQGAGEVEMYILLAH